jgi:hypothetical protein
MHLKQFWNHSTNVVFLHTFDKGWNRKKTGHSYLKNIFQHMFCRCNLGFLKIGQLRYGII